MVLSTATIRGDSVTSADPAKTADELDKWAAGLEQKARQYTELRQRMDGASASESSSDGAVRVTVDANGVPTDIELSDRVRDLAPGRLSAEIMSCMRRAQARLRAQVEDIVAATVPADDEPARNIVAEYRQRFPDPAEEPDEPEPDGGARLGSIEDDGEDDEAAAPPPPRRSTVDRPADDDWDDESPLRG